MANGNGGPNMRKGWFLKIDIDKFYGRNRKKGNGTMIEGFEGLVMPGRCENCGKNGPRFRYRNPYADPVIQMDLCAKCADTALHCLAFFKRTPAGWEARKKRLLAEID